MIYNQSVKTTESGDVGGYDSGKKIKGCKHYAMMNTNDCTLKLQAHSADIQDRDGAGSLLRASPRRWPFVALSYADGGYAGPRVAEASPIRIAVVAKADNQVGFAVIVRHRMVECFFAWINRNRRPAKDFEVSIASIEAFLYAASTIILLQRPGGR